MITFDRPTRKRTDLGLRRTWRHRDYMIHRTGAGPFVCWVRFLNHDEIDGRWFGGFRPIGTRRTLKAAMRHCTRHAKNNFY